MPLCPPRAACRWPSTALSSSIDRRPLPAGLFGLGWATTWQTSLSTDASGNVTIDSGGVLRYFVKQANGSYLDTDGEYGTLTQSGGIYTFTGTSGTQYVFLANGLLNYEQDTNGNRITLGYNAQNQLVTLTYSNPSDPSEPTEQLTLTYNSQGFVSQVADGTGDTWTYAYDSAGHLLSVTGPGNLTTSYTYDTGTNPETANALLSITNPDGSQQNFTYDCRRAGSAAPARTAAPTRSPTPTTARPKSPRPTPPATSHRLVQRPRPGGPGRRSAGRPFQPTLRHQRQPASATPTRPATPTNTPTMATAT